MRKNYFMKSISIILMLLVMMFSCNQPADVGSNNSNQQTNENQGNENGENNNPENPNPENPNPVKPNPVKPNPEKLTLQDVINNANAGEEIDLSKYKLTNYNATINKKLTIKNGNLDGAKLTVNVENVKLEKLEKLSVSTTSKLTINDSKLNDLLIGGNRETSRSRATESEMSLAMVSVTGCEIAQVQLDGFNSQLNITDTATEIDDIFTSTKAKLILEAGSYDGMKDPVVEDNGELTRIDMTKDKKLSILSIYSNPKKTEYEIGEEIDLTGLAVMGTYTASIEIFRSGGWKGEEIESVTKLENDYIVTVNENFDTAGVKIVTITSNIETGIKCYFHVYVKDSQNGEIQEPDITDVKVKDLEKVKTSYKIGEKLDLSCYQVVGFCNGFEINLSYTSEPANGTTLTNAGEETITFYYKGENIGTKSISVTEPRKIEFYDGIDSSKPLYTTEAVDGELLKLPVAPSKTGYTFDGWYNGDEKVTSEYIVKNDLKLTAKWTANIYTITYNLYEGENNPANPRSYTIETSTITLSSPTKTGYTFGGWYTDSNFSTDKKVTEIKTGSTGNITLYAKWTANKSVITITLPSINDAKINLQQVTRGNTVTFTAADSFDSYAWYIDGVKQSETSATFTIDTLTMNPIIYKIMVMVSKDDKYYSATADLKIDREQ